MGLFNIGKISTNSEYVRIVMPNAKPNSYVDKKLVDKYAKMYVNNEIRILNDCVKLVNETKTPKVFFERYIKLFEIAETFAILEKYFPFTKPLPSEQLSKLKIQKPITINDFIERYYQNAIEQINTVKTEKSKKNKINNFYSIMDSYKEFMLPENIKKYTELYEQLTVK